MARDHLRNQLDEIRNKTFGRSLVPMHGHTDQIIDDLEPKEPVNDYKGPLRRQPNIRRGGKDRRCYIRRKDPELTGQRGTGKKE